MNISWQESLKRLKAGNNRFVTDKLDDKLQNSARREELLSGQNPISVILSCSDSRVVPEFAFDTGLGEIFVIRVAGNVANISSLASMEYAILHLNVKLIVVLGHESCGAITAALENRSGKAVDKHFKHLFRLLNPAIVASKTNSVNDVVKKNVFLTKQSIYKYSKIIQKEVDNQQVRIIPAYYHLNSGKVDFYEVS